MKHAFITLLAVAFCSTALAEVESGKPAPDFTATDIHGKTHKLSDYRGKIVVLEAYNLDCPFVKNHYKTGAMQELQKEIASKGGIWLVVNSVHEGNSSHRNAEAAKNEWATQKMNATASLDDSSGEVGKKYGMRTTPHVFVIDQQGVLAYQGAIDDKAATNGDPREARNYVRETLAKLEAGGRVQVSHTKPYGCGIKYAN